MLLAVSMMYLRFMILILIFSKEIFIVIYPYLLIMALMTAAIALLLHRRTQATGALEEIEEETTENNPLEFKVALIFAGLFVAFTVITHYTLIYAGTSGLNVLSFVAGLSDITPFILNLLQETNTIAAFIIAACTMQAIISNIVVNMFYAIFFSNHRKELIPHLLRGFGLVISVNAALLIFFYI